MSKTPAAPRPPSAEYGFDFPDDFYRFWEFVNRLAPLDPLQRAATSSASPSSARSRCWPGRFDGRVPKHSLLLHWRYYDDPPEFFTVLAGDSDGLHWGYLLDDPDAGPAALRRQLLRQRRLELSEPTATTCSRPSGCTWNTCTPTARPTATIDPADAEEYDRRLAQLARYRERLLPFTERREVGEAYTDAYAGAPAATTASSPTS